MGKPKIRADLSTPDGVEAPLGLPQNSLLAALPHAELSAVMARTERISFHTRQNMFDKGDPIEHCWFPLTGMASLVTVLKDGTFLEALNVGREGFVGVPLINGVSVHQVRGFCQIAGDFLQIESGELLRLVEEAPRFSTLLRRYVQFAHEVVTQSAACNSMHLLEQRCARWLLTTSDSVDRTSFNLTQEFLSQMLAVRRAGVTVAVGALERNGLIEHRYGEVAITDLNGMRAAACECYETVREKARELLGE